MFDILNQPCIYIYVYIVASLQAQVLASSWAVRNIQSLSSGLLVIPWNILYNLYIYIDVYTVIYIYVYIYICIYIYIHTELVLCRLCVETGMRADIWALETLGSYCQGKLVQHA